MQKQWLYILRAMVLGRCAYLLSSQHHRNHTLRLRGLGALINEDGAELHLGQARVTSTDARATDNICILNNTQTTV